MFSGAVFRRCAMGAVAVSIAAGPAVAGGFYIPYQSGQAIASGLAGASARGDDPTFFYFNPASIAGTLRPEFVIDARAYWANVSIKADHARSPAGTDITGAGSAGRMAGPSLGPTSFAVLPLSRDLTLGFSGSTPFASVIDAPVDWAGRFHLISTNIKAINVSAALAWQATPWLAVAAGPQASLLKTRFTAQTLLPVASPVPIEGRGFLDGDDWALGAVAGIVLTPTRDTRIGLSYRSHLEHRAEGHAGAYFTGIARDTAAFDFDLPEVISAGLEQRLTDRIRLFAEVQWIGWGRFNGFDISFGSGRPNDVTVLDFADSWIGALGAGVKVTPATEITAGASYDTKVSEGSNGNLSPDADRVMIGTGLTTDLGGGKQLSLHYAHVFFDDVALDVTSRTKGDLEGTFETSLDMVGVTLRFAQ